MCEGHKKKNRVGGKMIEKQSDSFFYLCVICEGNTSAQEMVPTSLNKNKPLLFGLGDEADNFIPRS